MERDFTIACYEDFCALVNQINDEKWCGVSDWFGDLFLCLKHLLADWGILDYINKMDTYYKELLDRKDASTEHVAQVFEDISSLDSTASGGSHFAFCRKQLEAYRNYITKLTLLATDGQDGGDFAVGRIQALMGEAWGQIQKHSLPFLPDHQFSASSFSKISQEKKEAYVSRCEAIAPNLAKKVNHIFSDPDWTDREKLDIKFMIYSAPEPYRSIYLTHISRYDVVVFQDNSEDSEGATISKYSGKILLKDGDDTFLDNPRGPYNTFFHESGHATDDFATALGALSGNFWSGDKNLLDYIVADTRDYVGTVIIDLYPELTDSQRRDLLVSLNLAEGALFEYEGRTAELSFSLEDHREKIIEIMKDDLAGATNEAASDVYSGVTNNAIIGNYGHKGKEYEYYWYDEDGASTKMQSSELWAEFFAAQMTHDEEALASIKAHFPTAYPVLEEMACQMAAPY